MSVCSRWALTPLSKFLRVAWVMPLVVVIQPASAAFYTELVDGTSRDINASTREANWRLSNSATLNAVGARTGWIDSRNSTLNLSGTTVEGSSNSGASVLLSGSEGNISNSVISGGEVALAVALANGRSASATVTGSTLSGNGNALRMATRTQVDINDSTLTATGPQGNGYEAFGGRLNITGSQVTGAVNGGWVWTGASETDPHALTLDNSHLVGQTGAALLVTGNGINPNGSTPIKVLNGSTLTGGNGNLLEVDNANAQMDVQGSELKGNLVVRNAGQAGLNLDGARMSGDVTAEAGSTAKVALANGSLLSGRLTNVASLDISGDAQWAMVEDATVAKLAMNGGSVKMGNADAFYRLSLGELSGNGTFVIDADFALNQVDFLEVTGTATGSHSLLVGATGAEPVDPGSLHVVHVNQGDAQFSVVGGGVDIGTFRYELMQQGSNDWYLVETTRLTPSTGTVLALFNTAPTVWYGELSTLRSRMGELRLNGGQSGGWVRSYANKYTAKTASGVGYQQVQHGLSFGADAPLPVGDGQWLVGVMGGFSDSQLDLDRGANGRVSSYYLGGYTTWMDPASGYYFDGVVKLNRLRNKADVTMSDGARSKGDYHTNGIGASAEFGRHIKLDDGYFIEPYGQLAGVLMQGEDYRLDNGMRASADQTRSLLGKLGTTAGRNFDLGEGRVAQPYVRLAYAHEFASDNRVKVNNHRFNNDLSGSRGELGVGVAVSMNERLQLHADFDYANGDRIEQPWGANLGLRYAW